MSRSRGWCFTVNNYSAEEYEELKDKLSHLSSYFIIAKEVGKEGTPHLQGYVLFKNQLRLSSLRKINGRGHYEMQKGSDFQASKYCMKDGQYYEYGERPCPGSRNDLVKTKDLILSGKASISSIILDDPMQFHKYGRTLERIQDLTLRRKSRDFMTEGIWYWGPTGVGKSHVAFENFTEKTHYLYPNDNGWWDAYQQQETVIINDFRGEITFSFLLQLIDKWPVNVRRRGREPIPFLSKTVIITSSLPPDGVYSGVLERDDNIDQLLRRLKVRHIAHKPECLRGTQGVILDP